MRGEFVFTSFDTDDAEKYEMYSIRNPGHYISRCTIPADLLNEGRYALGVNASSYRVKRYFQDERALTFNVDALGAPGKQWSETRLGLVRPGLAWEIEEVSVR
jgi:lipopolysaccharide transport system ATP-binding protein